MRKGISTLLRTLHAQQQTTIPQDSPEEDSPESPVLFPQSLLQPLHSHTSPGERSPEYGHRPNSLERLQLDDSLAKVLATQEEEATKRRNKARREEEEEEEEEGEEEEEDNIPETQPEYMEEKPSPVKKTPSQPQEENRHSVQVDETDSDETQGETQQYQRESQQTMSESPHEDEGSKRTTRRSRKKRPLDSAQAMQSEKKQRHLDSGTGSPHAHTLPHKKHT